MYSYHYTKQKQRPRTKRYNTRTVKEPKRQPRTRAALFMALLLIIVFNKSVRKPDHRRNSTKLQHVAAHEDNN